MEERSYPLPRTIAIADVYSTVYPSDFAEQGLEFNLDAGILSQQIQFRVKDTKLWLGTNYLYLAVDNSFELPDELPDGFPNPDLSFDLGALLLLAICTVGPSLLLRNQYQSSGRKLF